MGNADEAGRDSPDSLADTVRTGRLGDTGVSLPQTDMHVSRVVLMAFDGYRNCRLPGGCCRYCPHRDSGSLRIAIDGLLFRPGMAERVGDRSGQVRETSPREQTEGEEVRLCGGLWTPQEAVSCYARSPRNILSQTHSLMGCVYSFAWLQLNHSVVQEYSTTRAMARQAPRRASRRPFDRPYEQQSNGPPVLIRTGRFGMWQLWRSSPNASKLSGWSSYCSDVTHA